MKEKMLEQHGREGLDLRASFLKRIANEEIIATDDRKAEAYKEFLLDCAALFEEIQSLMNED